MRETIKKKSDKSGDISQRGQFIYCTPVLKKHPPLSELYCAWQNIVIMTVFLLSVLIDISCFPHILWVVTHKNGCLRNKGGRMLFWRARFQSKSL